MDEKRLREFEQLERATSQGEWKLFSTANLVEIQLTGGRPVVAWLGFDDCLRPHREHRANAKFIVRAHAIVPALVADVRAQAAEIELLHAALHKILITTGRQTIYNIARAALEKREVEG